MIKKFEDFINESKNSIIVEKGVYGEALFESITNSLMTAVNESINEGKISLEYNMLNEGFFTNLFKGAAKNAEGKVDDANAKKDYFKKLSQEVSSGGDLIKLGLSIKKEEVSENVWKLINTLCEDAVELCEKLNQKEEDAKLAITKKLTETKQAIDTFANPYVFLSMRYTISI